MRLARTADRGGLRGLWTELDHAAVPDLDHLVDARAREDERPVLVPVEREDLPGGRGDGERSGGKGRSEVVHAGAGGRVCGGAEVEDLERAVGRASRDDVRLVRGEEGLVDTGRVCLEGRERSWTFWGPLHWGQSSTPASVEATYEFHGAVPGRGDELVLVDVGPVDGEDFARVLLPGTDREVLDVLANIERDVRWYRANLPGS